MMKSKDFTILLLSPVVYSLGILLETKFFSLALLSAIVFVVILCKARYIKNETSQIMKFFLLFVLFSGIITFGFDYNSFRNIALNRYYVLPFLCVLLSSISYSEDSIKVIVRVVIVTSLIYIMLFFMYFSDIMGLEGRNAIRALSEEEFSYDSITKAFGMASCFLLLVSHLLNWKYRTIVYVTFGIVFIFSIFLARRNLILTNGLFFIFALYNYIKSRFSSKIVRNFYIVCMVIALLIISLNFTNFVSNSNIALFDNLSWRLDQDTRGGVTNAFYAHMGDNFFRWLLGSGLESSYYCPGISDVTDYRSVIETGWQHVILKLGIIGLLLMLIIALKPVLRRQTNILTRSCAIFVFISIFEMIPAGVPTFELRYLLLWISVSICLDNKYRNLSDAEIRQLFKFSY